MTWKGNDRQLANLSTHATEYVLCAEKTRLELLYQFCPQGLLKMADDRTGYVCGVSVSRSCSNR